MKLFILLFCFTLAIAKKYIDNKNPVVLSPIGSFRGSIMKSQLGKNIYSFRGIRYAEAPTCEHRFKQAIPVECHVNTFDATEDGPICPQPDVESHKTSEDCLRLNIYTTALPDKSHNPNMSVIVFLHPGGFARSSGSSFEIGPQFVVDHDLVFVSINYRLGTLGFLSTGDERAPGNAGLKDQVLALRWIQENIEAFGGNPKSVTLYGHSAGAVSATLHMVSPMSKGLFHRVMTNGAAATTQKEYPTDQNVLVKKQAELLNCPTENLDEMFNCFYEKSAQDFVDSYAALEAYSDYPRRVWLPVVESSQSNDDEDCADDDDAEVFLTGQPDQLIIEGNANFVPYFCGVLRDEFGYLVIPAEEQAQCGNTTLYDELNNNWEELAPKLFGYESGTSKSCEISQQLKSFYLHDEPLEAGNYQGLAQLYADSLTIFQMHRFGRLLATYSPEHVYYYYGDQETCDTMATWSNGTRFGIVHYDEIPMLFNVAGRPEHCETDVKLADFIWGLISNFANCGDPTPKSKSKEFPVKWLPFTADKPQYYKIFGHENSEMIDGVIYEERMNLWDKLFPIISSDSTECDD